MLRNISPIDTCLLTPQEDRSKHFQTIVENISLQCIDQSFLDVTIYCRDKNLIKTNSTLLACSSKIFRSVFESGLNSFVHINYDLFCHDYDSNVIRKVLDLVYTGTSTHEAEDESIINDMSEIINCLGINILMQSVSIVPSQTQEDEVKLDIVEVHNFEQSCGELTPSQTTGPHFQLVQNELQQDETQQQDPLLPILEVEAWPWDSTQVQNHQTTCNPQNFECDICQQTFSLRFALNVHKEKHVGENLDQINQNHTESADIHLMTIDTVDFQSANLVLEASSNLPSTSKFKCLKCGRSFKTRFSLDKHMKKLHPGGQENVMPPAQQSEDELPQYKVDDEFCIDLETSCKRQMNEPVSTLKCKLCLKTFRNKQNLRKHHTMVHSQDDVMTPAKNVKTCHLCSETFPCNKTLVLHLTREHKGKNLVAERKLKKKKTKKKKHQNRNESPGSVYKCHLCSYTQKNFKKLMWHYSSSHYREEMNQFFGSKLNSCGLCSVKKTSVSCLLFHLVSVHNVLEPLAPKREELEVLETEIAKLKNQPKLSKNGKNRKQHGNCKQEKRIVFKCHLCHEMHQYHIKLMVHYLSTHFRPELNRFLGRDLNSCGLCPAEKKTTIGVLYHLVSVHNVLESLVPKRAELQFCNPNFRD